MIFSECFIYNEDIICVVYLINVLYKLCQFINLIFNIQWRIIGIESVDLRKKEKEGKEYFSIYSYVLFVRYVVLIIFFRSN